MKTSDHAPFRDWLERAKDAGLDTIPGTAAEILDDEVRWVLTKGKLPADQWVEVVTTAHELGIRSSSTMMYGHVDRPDHWVKHLRVLQRIQDRTGGFTEFVPLPFVHTSAPIYLAGVARPGPTMRDNLAVHAVSRILLHGRIDNIQTSWVKLGVEGTRAMLEAGAIGHVQVALSDATGIAALEALATGVPVIASRAGALPETVGPAGIIVEPRDPARLANALSAMWTGGTVAQQVTRSARRAAKARRTWADVCRETREGWSSVADGGETR